MLPYGISDFRRIKLENYYYVDKAYCIYNSQHLAKLGNDGFRPMSMNYQG